LDYTVGWQKEKQKTRKNLENWEENQTIVERSRSEGILEEYLY
jgi:hypothetical protein